MKLKESLQLQHTQESMLFMVGMVLRCWFIDKAPFWYDEGFSAILAQLSPSSMLRATIGDVHPPLYYALLSLWSQLMGGYSPLILREFSAVLSILSMWQVMRLMSGYQLGRYPRLGVMALVTLSPMLIYYGQEARMYSLLVFLVLEAWIQVLHKRWGAVAVVTALLMYTHNYGLLYAACLGLIALLRALREIRPIYRAGIDTEISNTDIPAVILSFSWAIVLYLPWVIYGLSKQLGTVGGDFWTRHMGQLGGVLGTTSLLMGSKVDPMVSVTVCAVVIGTLPFTLKTALREHRLEWLIMAGAPVAMVMFIGNWVPIYLVRGFLPILPAVYLLLVMMWGDLLKAPSPLKVVLLGVVLGSTLTGLVYHIGYTQLGLQKYNPLAFNTQADIRPGVPVIHLGDFSQVNWMASRPEVSNQLYLSPCPPLPGELSMDTREAMGMQFIKPGALPAEYYVIPYIGNLSNQCQVTQAEDLTKGLEVIHMDIYEYGEGGIYYHANK
jgi:hypothetical protein